MTLLVTGSAGHAVMTGAPWQVAVIIGALLIFAAGVATAGLTSMSPASARIDCSPRRATGWSSTIAT